MGGYSALKDHNLEPPPPPKYISCPACGSEMYDYLVIDIDNDVVGCSECTKEVTADEYLEREEEDNAYRW